MLEKCSIEMFPRIFTSESVLYDLPLVYCNLLHNLTKKLYVCNTRILIILL